MLTTSLSPLLPHRWEADDSYCRTVVMKPGSDYYHGLLEFTDSCILDFLMGQSVSQSENNTLHMPQQD